MRKKQFKSREEEIEAIRREPAFRSLVAELKSQSPEEIDRAGTWLDEAEKGTADEGREPEDS